LKAVDSLALQRCCDASPALADELARDPEGWVAFLALEPAQIDVWLASMAALAQIEACVIVSLKSRLHRRRRQLAYQIACVEILELAPIEATLRALSVLADTLITQAYDATYAELIALHGIPRSSDGQAHGMAVMALGKLGGLELNFSSDVDLIFVFGEHGQSDGARGLDNEAFFLRLGQRLIAVLNDPSELVYRVDMRLRPFGESGRLALSLNALENYYQNEGRDWERYAWIKARVCAGDMALGGRTIQLLKPFVYRRYLDFTALSGLRAMKLEIERKVARVGRDDDLKLGQGGIREIEFIVQLEQLIRGGREPALRTPSLAAAISAQIALRPDRAGEFAELKAHYALLRRVENRVQMVRDQQCHALPEDLSARLRVAQSLGYPDAAALEKALVQTKAAVRAAFERVLKISEPVKESAPALESWMLEMIQRLRTLAESERLSARVQGYLDALLPQLARRAVASDLTEEVAERVFKLIAALLKRGTYLALITEQPLVQERILSLAARSAWLVDALVERPVLLDELIDPRLFELESNADIAARLASRLSGDLEADMDTLRQAKSAQLFRIGLSYLDARIDATSALARFSELAELLLARALDLAVANVAQSMGLNAAILHGAIAVIGYGSLGAGELAPSSDLDVLFLLSDDAEPSSAFRRIAQRLLHILTTQTGAGRLFEVDTRLKPNGSAGQLVSTISAFARYQRESAWTWEHQALVHARAVAGSAALATAFEELRAWVLTRPREPKLLEREISDMLLRLRETRDPKHAPSGPTELKFAAERCVLSHAAQHPELLRPRGAAQILEMAARLGIACPFSAADAIRIDRWRLERALGLGASE